MGTGTIFAASFQMPSFVSTFYVAPNGGNVQTVYGMVATIMPVACTFDQLYVAGTPISTSANSLTVTLLKNGSPQSLTASINVLTANTTVTASDTTDSFSVAVGDTVAYQITQTSAPTVRVSVSLRCK
jgi:hypothetical protein